MTIVFMGHAEPAMSAAASAYEDDVLPLLAEHGGELLFRGRRRADQETTLPLEVHVIRFPTRASYDSYLADNRRAALLEQHGEVFTSKVVVEVDSP